MTQEKTANSRQEETINSSDEQHQSIKDLDDNVISHITGGLPPSIERPLIAGGFAGGSALTGFVVGSALDNNKPGRKTLIGTTSGLALGGAMATIVDRKRFGSGATANQTVDAVTDLAHDMRTAR